MKSIKGFRLTFLLVAGLFFAMSIWSQSSGQQVVGGVTYRVDTLASHQVGPGAIYTAVKYSTSAKQIRVFFLEVDAKNPYVRFESTLGVDSLITTELVSGMAKRKSKDGNLYFAGTNAGFFVTQGDVGYPIHGCMADNQIGRVPGGTPLIAFSGSDPIIDNISFGSSSCTVGDRTWTIHSVNSTRSTNNLIAYNTLNGKYTHTNAYGTELLLKLPEGESWKVNAPVVAQVIAKQQNKGNMFIPPQHVVLSGHGTAAEFLNQVNINDQIQLNFKFQFPSLSGSPSVNAMVGGDRVILSNGQVTDNDWAELHPRTGIGYSQDKSKILFCVVDGRSGLSAGVRTKELADIMKSAGAYQAINLDGGGSSALYTSSFGVMNIPSDGRERAVSNAIYAVTTAPNDTQIAQIKASVPSIALPRYGAYTPVFYGYNQYGVLINTNVEGVTLSCDPQMGEIREKMFFASGTEGGFIVGSYQGIQTRIKVNLTTEITPALRLDSVLVDYNHPYQVEIQAVVNERIVALSPEAFEWSVDDPSVCSVDKGVIRGIANGRTYVRGRLNGAEIAQKVIVEIPSKTLIPVDEFNDYSGWEVKGSSNLSSLTLDASHTPVSINYNFVNGRAPYIQLTKPITLYSIPNSLRVTLNSGIAAISSFIVNLKASTSLTYTPVQYSTIPVGQEHTWDVKLSELFSTTDRSIYPIQMNGIKIMLDNLKHPTGNTSILLKEFSMNYGTVEVGVNHPELLSRIRVYPNPIAEAGVLSIAFAQEPTSLVRMELIDYNGTLLRSSILPENSSEVVISLKGVSSGVYFLRLIQEEDVETLKIIVK